MDARIKSEHDKKEGRKRREERKEREREETKSHALKRRAAR
jgi:hypothetical protein